jgi:hypothetical protein
MEEEERQRLNKFLDGLDDNEEAIEQRRQRYKERKRKR